MKTEHSLNEPAEILEAASVAVCNLLPVKSKTLYDAAYERFKSWCVQKNVEMYTENVMLAYFGEKVKDYKSSTMWAQYSMVKACMIIYDNIDISRFPKLMAFLKRNNDGYQAKKSKVLTKEEIDRFLMIADDKDFLMIKVKLLFSLFNVIIFDLYRLLWSWVLPELVGQMS